LIDVHLDGVEEKKREKQQKKRNSRSGVQDDEEAMKCAGSQCRRRAGIKKMTTVGFEFFRLRRASHHEGDPGSPCEAFAETAQRKTDGSTPVHREITCARALKNER